MLDKLKDYSIAYSFDRTGYERHARTFQALDPETVAGKHYFITGGTRGIGEAVAKALLAMGAEVTVSARSDADFQQNFGQQDKCHFLALDLTDFDAIRKLPLGRYDGLVLNAGGMPETLTVIEDLFDTIFASQVAGHYLLMRRCIEEDRLRDGCPIHWVASGGMYLQRLDLSDLAWQERDYDKVKSYANAKRAQVVLNELFADAYPGHTFSCSHPGWVGTEALKEAMPGFSKRLGQRLRTAAQGADTIVWCLSQGTQLKSGLFWFDRQARSTTPFFWTRERKADRHALMSLLEDLWGGGPQQKKKPDGG